MPRGPKAGNNPRFDDLWEVPGRPGTQSETASAPGWGRFVEPATQRYGVISRSFRQLRRFDHVINSDKVFSTHKAYLGVCSLDRA
jgi:hypothetical protein